MARYVIAGAVVFGAGVSMGFSMGALYGGALMRNVK